MNVVVFGASGRTGKQVLLQALARGHHVTAVVRNPASFALHYDRLTVVAGDALRRDSVEAAVEGQDAVVSAMGVSGFLNSLRPMTFYRDSARNLVEAMRAQKVRRLVVTSSIGVLDDPSAPVWYRALVKPLLRHKYADMKNMEQVVSGSGLEWTVARAGQLVDGPLTQEYRVGKGGSLPDVTRISTSDLGDFLAAQATDDRFIGRAVAVSY